MRASGRSILFTMSMTGSFDSSALRSTKRVCGSGPSLASTSSSTPSTMVSARSTSPPKSAWPGVSTMLIFTSPYRTAVFLARIVIPFSRSRSLESITRSGTMKCASMCPDCFSIASTRVVLPWSTCAMIATFLISPREAEPPLGPGMVSSLVMVGSERGDDSMASIEAGETGRRQASRRRSPPRTMPPRYGPSPSMRTSAGCRSVESRTSNPAWASAPAARIGAGPTSFSSAARQRCPSDMAGQRAP